MLVDYHGYSIQVRVDCKLNLTKRHSCIIQETNQKKTNNNHDSLCLITSWRSLLHAKMQLLSFPSFLSTILVVMLLILFHCHGSFIIHTGHMQTHSLAHSYRKSANFSQNALERCFRQHDYREFK